MKSTINLVTGGAGFIGSHLIDSLIKSGNKVICIDNLRNGSLDNIKQWEDHDDFKFIKHDVRDFFSCEIDNIWHLASIASPKSYLKSPLETINTCFMGTVNALELARKYNAKILLASSSEIYGDSKFNILKEEDVGSVNCFSQRASYSEGKRISETLLFNYKNLFNLDIRVARIFNTYGPRLSLRDGRVITSFINSTLNKEPLTIYGDGNQTRSFCYINDMVEGLIKLMDSSYDKPLNLGSNHEIKINDLANLITSKIYSSPSVEYHKQIDGDPISRKPCLKKSKMILGWEPLITLDEGLDLLINNILRNK